MSINKFANEAILDIFQNFRKEPLINIDEYETKGKLILDEKINKFTSSGKPIEFSMMGIPFKSINDRDKVIGVLPDLGEQMMFENFDKFSRQVKEKYEPGIKIHLISDGYAFNHLMDVPDNRVAAYEEVNKELAKIAPVQIYDMFDFFNRDLSANQVREKVNSLFGIDEAELDRRILFDPDVKTLYTMMILFMGDDLAINHYDSGNQRHKAAKRLARQMMLWNEAYSKMIQSEFSDKIRLSMHPSVNNGVKYSFNLLDNEKARTQKQSPWHSCIVRFSDGTVATMKRAEAEALGYELIQVDGRNYYFNAN